MSLPVARPLEQWGALVASGRVLAGSFSAMPWGLWRQCGENGDMPRSKIFRSVIPEASPLCYKYSTTTLHISLKCLGNIGKVKIVART
jgi:hypothetical protein